MSDRTIGTLDEAECLRLTALGGIGRECKVAFEIDEIDTAGRGGWSVLIQGPAHHVSDAERAAAIQAGVESWAGGERELFVRIVPSRITGRRISPA
jgi:Pyridoxamine 5'-phosphate oxidase